MQLLQRSYNTINVTANDRRSGAESGDFALELVNFALERVEFALLDNETTKVRW